MVGAGAIAAWMAMAGREDTPVEGAPAERPRIAPDAGSLSAGPGNLGSSPAPRATREPDAAVAGSAAAQAAQLADAGRSEAAAGHYAQAHALYQQAYTLDPQPATLFELGLLEHLSGRCRDARRTTQGVLAASPGGTLGDKARQLLDKIGRCD